MKDQLLNAPIGAFSGVHLGLRGAGKRVRAGELLELTSGAPDDPEHFALQRHLEDPSRESTLPDEQHLRGSRSDTNRIGRANHAGERVAAGLLIAASLAIAGAFAWQDRHALLRVPAEPAGTQAAASLANEQAARLVAVGSVDTPADVWAFRREGGAFVALNLGAEPVSLDGVEGAIVIGTDRARDGELLTGVLELRPCEAVVASA